MYTIFWDPKEAIPWGGEEGGRVGRSGKPSER